MALLTKIFGSRNNRYIKSIEPLIEKINSYEDSFQKMDDAELKGMTAIFKDRFNKGETLDALLPEAFAVAREAGLRSLGLRAFDEQLIGGIILHQGKISEMKTGEGKTLVATLPAYLNAIAGRGVHVVTVNDYLAIRDCAWMRQVYEALGMTCFAITNDLSPEGRQTAYQADVTYATNNELGFDYLRDNMAFTLEQRVQREEKSFAIVDEVDSILIDEARTPLIVSGPTEDKTELYQIADKLMPKFVADKDYELDEKSRVVALTDAGMDTAEALLRTQGLIKEHDSLYEMEHVLLVHHLNQALKAHTIFTKDIDYIVKDDQVIIIDEFTGRMSSGRRFSEGLHQALEAKEQVTIQNENQTLASVTFQNYFRMYDKLAGMTGTADTEAEEFESIYGLQVIIIPTHVPVARKDGVDIIYRTKEEKSRAIVKDIRDCYERGQPVLVGTTSIEKSEEFASVLKKHKIPHNVLNAKLHEKEADIISQAGRLGAVTIATNMAGRGTDIKLGGNLDLLLEEASEKNKRLVKDAYEREKNDVLNAGGLRVISTERHESRRIDNQLRGRSGRQGDPGSSIFYISLQDDLMRIFAGGLENVMQNLEMPKDEAITSRLVSAAIETAQKKIEGRNFEVRKTLLKYDDVLNEQRKVIYEQRKEVMGSETVDDIILDFREECLEIVWANCFPQGTYSEQWLIENFNEEVLRLFNLKLPIEDWVAEEGVSPEDILKLAQKSMHKVWQDKEDKVGSDNLRQVEKMVLLQVMDHQWKDHLQRLDFLRQGIHLRGYAQKDPLNEFKREAFGMFEGLLTSVRNESVAFLSRVEVQTKEEIAAEEATLEKANQAELANAKASNALADNSNIQSDNDDLEFKNGVLNGQKIPRNAPCPCGGGKKYKQCHGRIA